MEVMEVPDSSITDKVVDLLNAASLASEEIKIKNLQAVQELIIHADRTLLDNFLDEVTAFQSDLNADVRKAVVCFIEEACKADTDMLPKVVANLQLLMQDHAISVVKRSIQAVTQLYKTALVWISTAKTITDLMASTWSYLNNMKTFILQGIDHDNDGVRTMCVKFMEVLIRIQTYKQTDSQVRGVGEDFSLDDVPTSLKIANPKKLEEEAKGVFEILIKFHGYPHISSANLQTAMGVLSNICKQRPQFMERVIVALESLHANLPPTLSKSQVSSVRKMLKVQLLNLLKHPSSYPYQSNITTLLHDLGATNNELRKYLPSGEELRKRQRTLEEAQQRRAKKAKVSVPAKAVVTVEEEEEIYGVQEPQPRVKELVEVEDPIKETQNFIAERLSSEFASMLVLSSMLHLPETMPPHFSSTYTPIAAAGTPEQIQHVARLLASQLTNAGIGPTATHTKHDTSFLEEKDVSVGIGTVVGGTVEDIPAPVVEMPIKELPISGMVPLRPKPKASQLYLGDITKTLHPDERIGHLGGSLLRILQAERGARHGGVLLVRNKILSSLAASLELDCIDILVSYCCEEMQSRGDLLLMWLYEEYCQMQNFSSAAKLLGKDSTSTDDRYNTILCTTLNKLIDKPDSGERDSLFERIFLEAPLITEPAVHLAITFCTGRSRAAVGVRVLENLVNHRPPKQLVFLFSLVELSAHEDEEVRTEATAVVLSLAERSSLKKIIIDYATMYLRFLFLAQPPEMLFGAGRGRPVVSSVWTEDIEKVCLYLYLALLPTHHVLVHELAQVYVKTGADIKRCILRVLEAPVRGMGMDSPELLKLVETCPKGAETLVTRVIHILTDKCQPSSALVSRVRELYQKRVSDVRFLIPVLTGLTKEEVTSALPKLIKLNQQVVKEVFNRLLGLHVESLDFSSPLTPAELLLALHNIPTEKADIKTVIKATSLCFTEQAVYTAEVLAMVIQQLVEQIPLPTLLMRTVIQAYSLYPRLVGFIMNILQRLITKKVWTDKRVWEGFVRCCERTLPQSYTILLQLPSEQLAHILKVSKSIQQGLYTHVLNFTDNQRSHISANILDIVLGGDPLEGPEINDIYADGKDSSSRNKTEFGNGTEMEEVPPSTGSDEPAPPGVE